MNPSWHHCIMHQGHGRAMIIQILQLVVDVSPRWLHADGPSLCVQHARTDLHEMHARTCRPREVVRSQSVLSLATPLRSDFGDGLESPWGGRATPLGTGACTPRQFAASESGAAEGLDGMAAAQKLPASRLARQLWVPGEERGEVGADAIDENGRSEYEEDGKEGQDAEEGAEVGNGGEGAEAIDEYDVMQECSDHDAGQEETRE